MRFQRAAAKCGQRVLVLDHRLAGLLVDQWRTLHSCHMVHHAGHGGTDFNAATD